jgi:rod shape-determining protein MreD
MNVVVQNIIRFGLILSIQIFLLNNVQLESATLFWGVSLFKPFFYLLFILMLPANLSAVVTMLICFVTGFIMDKYCMSVVGLHASACVLIGLIRPFVLDLFFRGSAKDAGKPITPSLSKMGFRNFFIYIIIVLTIFVFYFYLLDFWSFRGTDILKMLLKMISCLFTTIILVILSQVLFINTNKKKRR